MATHEVKLTYGGSVFDFTSGSNTLMSYVPQSPDMTLQQMQEIVVRVLNKEKHWPKFLAKLASRQIPKLERWKT